MSVEVALWRMTAEGPVPVTFSPLQLESRLEDMVVKDPSLVGLDILVVGRQVLTAFGGYVDLLGVDADGLVHILELKRDRTPREVVAQVLDYGSWAQDLGLDKVAEVYGENNDDAFADAFADRFGRPLPDTFNPDQRLTIIASELDAASDRIVQFLASRFGVPVNAVFFRYFVDGDHEYLSRTWLVAPDVAEKATRGGRPRKVRPWNGRDFYSILGTTQRHNRWPISHKYGFVSAGGGPVYSKPLRNLRPGHRVFAFVGGAGYVAVGEVTGTMQPIQEFVSEIVPHGQSVLDQPDVPEWLRESAESPDSDFGEFVVPVNWTVHRPTENAVWEKGLFSSQISVCKLRDERTLETLISAFKIAEVGSPR